MAGIEVAGLVLGALPLVLNSVDAYRDSFRRFGTAFNKRKHVEKLARALLLQQLTLDQLIQQFILASGCEDVSALDDDPVRYLNDPGVQEQLEQYLGPKNTLFLVDELKASYETVRKVARCISGLVPADQGPKDDLLAIIQANQNKPSLMVDLAPRIKLLLGITDMKDMIQEIDNSSASLDRFLRLALSNGQATNSHASRNSLKLAKAFRQIRGLAESLHKAVLDGFRGECHENHEARLYLDDRIDVVHQKFHRRGAADPDAPLMIFDLAFHAGGQAGDELYYETVVQVLDGDTMDNVYPNSTSEAPMNAAVSFCVTDATPVPQPNVATITSICTTIKKIRGITPRRCFVLLANRQMGAVPEDTTMPAPRSLFPGDHRDYVSLRQILTTSSSLLPLKPRVQLSLRLAASLLQLLRTQWIAQAWSKDTVLFLVSDTVSASTSRAKQNVQVDLSRPFVACKFGDELPVARTTEPKAALLELGILLLEIWHGTTLEARFGLDESDTRSSPMTYYERLVRALQWQDDGADPMLDFYADAVSHCLKGNHRSAGRDLDWEDSKLWGLICGAVVEPLSKLCKKF